MTVSEAGSRAGSTSCIADLTLEPGILACCSSGLFFFNVAFYLSLIIQMIFWTPYYFIAPRDKAWFVPKFWARTNHWLMEKLVGTKYEIDGLEAYPPRSLHIAPKHQSFWDTYAFVPFVPDPIYILKRELMWIPLFGWYVGKMKMIPVHRGSRSVALKSIVRGAQPAIAQKRQIMIYPEGTRRAPGDEPAYKFALLTCIQS